MEPLVADIVAGARPTMTEVLNAWGSWCPLLHELEDTPQDPEWHAEGNVLIHTNNVLHEVYQLLEGPASHLGQDRQLALILGAIFHDIAKPLTTRAQEIDGKERIVAPRHADRGRSYLAPKLFALDLPYSLMYEVLALVGHHHDPVKFVRKEAPAHKFLRLARQVDTELVYFLEVADMLGRTCNDLQKQLDTIEMFRMFAEEYNAWNNPTPHQDWHQRLNEQLADEPEEWQTYVHAKAVWERETGQIFTPEEAISRSYDAKEGHSHLVLLCGPSGSGKSTWVQRNLPGYEMVSMDTLRKELTGKVSDQSSNGKVRHMATDELKEHLRRKRNVVWDATNLRRDFRRPLIDLGMRYHARVSLVVFHIPEHEIIARNAQRQSAIPTAVLQKQLRNTEWPYLHEAHDVQYIDAQGQRLL
ncbi:MAG: HD domain-containing protein [Deltaproteobacteria bacterium]|nr:MAG: HD domain-containing protein [Deltaproteobacteria bacterium]